MSKLRDSFFEGMKFLDDRMGFYLKGNTEGVEFHDTALLRKPIGVASKSYGFMEKMLYENIGSHQFEHDGYATIIGMNANPYLNSETNPWFMMDKDREKYCDYLSYIDNVYFHGSMLPPNFQSTADKIKMFDYNALIEENARVGAIHHFDMGNVTSARLLIPNGATNPNGYNDTRLGVVNNFYLSGMLYNSYEKMMNSVTSSHHNPSFGYDENTLYDSFSVTQGAYSKFGLKGEYGIENGTYEAREGMVMAQSLLTDDIIMWSTVDNAYNSSGNVNRVGGMLGVNSEELTEEMTDNTKTKALSLQYSPFGNFYSLTYSLGLISASGGRTKDFIAKSIYGIDLMSNADGIGLLGETDIDSLKRISGKKYFASLATRGTNYIDAMTAIDVKFDTLADNDLAIIRVNFNDPGNDTFYNYNTFLTYAESEGKSGTPNISEYNSVNNGVNVGNYRIYSPNNVNEKKDIISYTNQQFKKNKYNTLIARFHTDSFDNPNDARLKKDATSSAVSQYGMSHGRNLLKRDHKNANTNGYHDPYCRVWTYHKQYSKHTDLIRPFIGDDKDLLDAKLKLSYQKNRAHLVENGVRNKINGIINYVPDKNDKYKKCMFSIENLAWKQSHLFGDKFFSGEIGPNGGRIMWFPPYGLTFNENVSTNWNSTQFIGRGEKIYSYVDTERSGTLSFQLLIDHPSLLNATHNAVDMIGDVDDVNSTEQQILRFFAGCEVLGEEIGDKEKLEEDGELMDGIQQVPIVPLPTIEQHDIMFDVYFPNNYSGIDDTPEEFIKYLNNGVGPQILSNGDEIYTYNGQTVGGYEMGNGCGISCITGWTSQRVEICQVTSNKNYTYVVNSVLFIDKNKKESRMGYRVDEAYSDHVYNTLNNRLDTNSSGLNSTSGENTEGCEKCSFRDMIFALGGGVEGQTVNQEKVDLIKKMLLDYDVLSVKLEGYSTNQGYVDSNKTLAANRAESIEKWLKTYDYFKKEGIFEEPEFNDNQVVNDKDINSLESKKNRKVSVKITLQKEVFASDDEIIESNPPIEEVPPVEEDELMRSNINYFDNINYSSIVGAQKNINGEKKSFIEQLAVANVLENQKKALSLLADTDDVRVEINGNKTYNEADFFNYVDSENSILRNKIVEKIKYFDPAYHTITPEGFNSRLTFLHQCTRQGSTLSASDTKGNNVRNLSFGTPPICVLRIGDFFNTKIIIDSMTISYDDASWDLNDEGIGVMPMMAKIDMNFKFIGGSDLSGPISRLQNAVSFNYYANTKVYNDMADINKNDTNNE